MFAIVAIVADSTGILVNV